MGMQEPNPGTKMQKSGRQAPHPGGGGCSKNVEEQMGAKVQDGGS